MSFITANDGTRLFYEEAGAGRPLVLLHGWTFSGQFFRDVVPPLAAQARVTRTDAR